MLLSILSGGGELGEKILYLLISVLALLPALTLHEWAHGYAAYKLGDSTAKEDGRLSLNPLDHIDPMGSLMMLLVGFGWAKPVPVNTRYFRKPKRDMAIVSIAGPLMNFAAAFISCLLYALAVYISIYFEVSGVAMEVIITVFLYSAMLNIGLGTFNLIPLPPLDGSNVLMCLLPPRLAMKYSQIRYYTRYIFLGIILLSYLPISIDIFYPLDLIRSEIAKLFLNTAEKMIAPFFEFI